MSNRRPMWLRTTIRQSVIRRSAVVADAPETPADGWVVAGDLHTQLEPLPAGVRWVPSLGSAWRLMTVMYGLGRFQPGPNCSVAALVQSTDSPPIARASDTYWLETSVRTATG